jgi:hypothetical protein
MNLQSDQPDKPDRQDRPDEPAFAGCAQLRLCQLSRSSWARREGYKPRDALKGS